MFQTAPVQRLWLQIKLFRIKVYNGIIKLLQEILSGEGLGLTEVQKCYRFLIRIEESCRWKWLISSYLVQTKKQKLYMKSITVSILKTSHTYGRK